MAAASWECSLRVGPLAAPLCVPPYSVPCVLVLSPAPPSVPCVLLESIGDGSSLCGPIGDPWAAVAMSWCFLSLVGER